MASSTRVALSTRVAVWACEPWETLTSAVFDASSLAVASAEVITCNFAILAISSLNALGAVLAFEAIETNTCAVIPARAVGTAVDRIRAGHQATVALWLHVIRGVDAPLA